MLVSRSDPGPIAAPRFDNEKLRRIQWGKTRRDVEDPDCRVVSLGRRMIVAIAPENAHRWESCHEICLPGSPRAQQKHDGTFFVWRVTVYRTVHERKIVGLVPTTHTHLHGLL